jgi:hypothetical protein
MQLYSQHQTQFTMSQSRIFQADINLVLMDIMGNCGGAQLDSTVDAVAVARGAATRFCAYRRDTTKSKGLAGESKAASPDILTFSAAELTDAEVFPVLLTLLRPRQRVISPPIGSIEKRRPKSAASVITRVLTRGSRCQAFVEVTWLVCSTIDSSTSRS